MKIYKNLNFLNLIPGIFVAILIALAAQFLSNNYQVPAMLMALLLGMALHFLGEEGKCVKGLDFSNNIILRIGIVLLSTRINMDLILSLELSLIIVVTSAVFLTIIFGIFILKAFGFDWKFGVLIGGSVAICGASAAMAIAAILPKDKNSEQQLTFTILGVTMLSTLAMIFYPILSSWINLDEKNAGIFLGATIHDVAQVIGAGFSVSDLAGETSTLIKLYRVTLLFPLVLVISLAIRNSKALGKNQNKTPLLPKFIIIFIFGVIINSLNLIPDSLQFISGELSKWCLLLAIAAVGAKTKLKSLKIIGLTPAFLIIATSLFLLSYTLFFINS